MRDATCMPKLLAKDGCRSVRPPHYPGWPARDPGAGSRPAPRVGAGGRSGGGSRGPAPAAGRTRGRGGREHAAHARARRPSARGSRRRSPPPATGGRGPRRHGRSSRRRSGGGEASGGRRRPDGRAGRRQPRGQHRQPGVRTGLRLRPPGARRLPLCPGGEGGMARAPTAPPAGRYHRQSMAIARIDELLSRDYVRDLASLPMAEVRSRRDTCQEAADELSYLRRLVQGRLDIVLAHIEAREGGEPADLAHLVEQLPAILAEGTRREGLGRLPTSFGPADADGWIAAELDAVADAQRIGRLAELTDHHVRSV